VGRQSSGVVDLAPSNDEPHERRIYSGAVPAQTNLYSAAVEETVAFYERLGFTERFRTPSEGVPIHVELELDGFTLGVADVSSARHDHGLNVTSIGRGAEVCVWVDDVDAAYLELLAHGATPMSAPHDWLDNLRVAWVTDPDGHPVELVQKRG
jgi:catechol 2,3-dioxygenase-like lactoylglutathione lyase family enzyme